MNETISHFELMKERKSVLEDIARTSISGTAKVNAGAIQYGNEYYPIDFFQTLPYSNRKKTALITAGIHGYEPAGVYALKNSIAEIVRDYSESFNLMVFPCLNPIGFIENIRGNNPNTHPENDINRSFNIPDNDPKKTYESKIISNVLYARQFDVAINLHEDNIDDIEEGFPNPTDFYMYFISEIRDKFHGFNIIENMILSGYNITNMTSIYRDPCEKGVICNFKGENQSRSHIISLEAYLEPRSDWIFTPETSTTWDLKKRIEGLSTATRLILDETIKK